MKLKKGSIALLTLAGMSCNQIIVALQTGEEGTIFIFLFLFLLLSLKLSIFEAAFPYLNTSTSLLIE